MKKRPKKSIIALAAFNVCCFSTGSSAPLTIINHSFETDAVANGDFDASTTSGPAGWGVYNTVGTDGFRQFGTLNPSAAFFDSVPDGSNVGLVFLVTEEIGEAGLQQTLSDTLQLNTTYTLTVEVGNFRDGDAGDSFDFDGFPGYRIDLMAGSDVLDSDNDSLTIAEGVFATSTVTFTTGASHMNEGEDLGIRLVNLNGSGIEVNFDNVRLDAAVVPEPSSITLLMAGAMAAFTILYRRR